MSTAAADAEPKVTAGVTRPSSVSSTCHSGNAYAFVDCSMDGA